MRDKQVSALMTLEARDGSVRWKVNPEHNSLVIGLMNAILGTELVHLLLSHYV